MATSDHATLSTPGGDTEFSPADGDGFYLTLDTTGFDQGPIRATVDDKPQTGGGIIHPFFGGPRRPTVVAQYLILAGSIDDRDAAIDDLVAQLDSIRDADGTWTQHRVGGDRSLTVRCEIPLVSSGGTQQKQVIFGLICADPNWS